MNHHVTSRIALLAAAGMVWWTCESPAQTTQEHVHSSAHGHAVRHVEDRSYFPHD